MADGLGKSDRSQSPKGDGLLSLTKDSGNSSSFGRSHDQAKHYVFAQGAENYPHSRGTVRAQV